MKTIDEAVEECSQINRMARTNIIYAFKLGAEFAQKWISVEEELPEIDNDDDTDSNVVLVKCKNCHYPITAYYDYIINEWVGYGIDHKITVISWRPIELK